MTKTRDLADLGGGFIQTGTGAVQRTVESKLQDVVSVLDFIPPGTNTESTDCTTFIQAAIDATQGKSLFFPVGTYLVTDTLTLYKGSTLYGENRAQGLSSYTVTTPTSKLLFQPTSSKDLFETVNLPLPSQAFKGKISVGNFIIEGNTIGGGTNSRYAFTLHTVIYGNFYNLEVRYFDSGILAYNTINNKFDNILIYDTRVSCVEYAGSSPPTTDVWTQCTFRDSPLGVRLASGIAIRFVDCLLENLNDFGVDIAKECSDIQWHNTYAENIPTDPSGAIFNVGQTGTTPSVTNVLTVIGGRFSGNNLASPVIGYFVKTDFAAGVTLSSCSLARFNYVGFTTANTTNNCIFVSGLRFNSCTNTFNDTTKVNGSWDIAAVNGGAGAFIRSSGISSGSLSFINSPAPVGTRTNATLSDTQTGTWTASLIGSITPPTSPVTTTGHYTKVGNLVTVRATFANVDTTGATGTIRVDGLPFASNRQSLGVAGLNGLGGSVLIAQIPSGVGYIDFINATTTVAANMVAGPAKYLFVTITYFTAL